MNNAMKIREELLQMQDIEYKQFQSKLIPNIAPDQIIGIRIPVLRKYVTSLKDQDTITAFMQELPHLYYEENNVHAYLIEKIKDYDECVNALEQFLPYVDNWATCDTMSPKVLKNEKENLQRQAYEWIQREDTYSVRFGIKVLMDTFLEETFQEVHLKWVADIHREEYYIKMMQSWYFATALAKQYDAAVSYLEIGRLDLWVHNKTIQKAIESQRITDSQKAYLRKLKRERG